MKVGFCAHRLNDIHHRFETVVGRGLSRGNNVAILGSNTKDDVLSDVRRCSFSVAEQDFDGTALCFTKTTAPSRPWSVP